MQAVLGHDSSFAVPRPRWYVHSVSNERLRGKNTGQSNRHRHRFPYVLVNRCHGNGCVMATDIDETMSSDEEKSKLAKLLQGLEVPEVKLTERCKDIVNLFHEKFDKEVEEEEMREKAARETETFDENPYKVDKGLLEENERKLRELLAAGKRAKKEYKESVISGGDPKRPWRTHTSKEKLLRIDNELKRHNELGSQVIAPMTDGDMRDLVKECQEETQLSAKISAERLRDTVDSAKKNLPNFQYRKVDNGTATAILPEAHDPLQSVKDVTPKK